GVWRGDSRSCEQRGIIYSGPTLTRPVNMNDNQSTPQPIKTTDTSTQPIQEPETVNDNQQPMENADTPANQVQTSPVKIPSNNAVIQQNDESNKSVENSNSNQPIRFNLTNSQPIRLSSSSSSDSSDHSKRTTWGQVKNTSPKKTKKDKQDIDEKESGSPHHSPTKHKNCKAMTSWKDISPSKSASSSDLEHSCHSNQSTDCTHRIFRFSSSRSLKDLNESTSSSNTDNEAQKPKDVENVNKDKEVKTCCKNECGSPCKKSGVCKCVKKCNVCCHDKQEKQISPDNQNALVNSQTSSNDNGSPKRERRDPNDDNCDNDYFYDEDFSVQFDTNLRETSVTPIESDPNTTILDFPNMVTGSYLRFNGGSSNVSFNNSKASSQNASVNTLKVSNTDNTIDLAAQYEAGQYDSENSGNSGSHVSTMEIDSSDQNMLGSSDLIDLSDGPLFTPTPSNSRNEESCDSLDGKGEGQVEKGQGEGQDSDMSGSNGSSSDTNLNVNCNTRKEEYFLSFDGSNSKVSGSETDISLSFTSHDSYQGHWMQSETSQGSHDLHCNGCHGEGHEASNEVSGSEGQEESTDSFHICFNKLSPRHKSGQYVARENLTGRVMKRLVTVKESSPEHGNSSEDENTRTSTTLTAGSKTVSSSSGPCHHHHDNKKPSICQNSQSQPQQQLKEQQLQNIKTKCCINIAKLSLKSDPDSASSSSGISTSSASSGIDPGYCDCRSRSLESPENDLERLIFFPPHTEEKIKIAKDCCNARRKAQSVPSRLSECANANGYETKFTKYANEARPLVAKVQCQGSKGQCRISAKWISGNKNVEGEVAADNLYALEEEQTPVASPDGPVYHRDSGCYENSCHDATCNHDNSSCGLYGGGETDFTESEFYQAVENDRMIVVGNGYYAGVAMDIDSNSSSGSSIPNGDRKPLKSCLRKRNRTLRSTRSMSATDTMTLNFDDIEAKVRNHRHSYGCDEVYIVQDEHGQMMMYQADDSAEPVMFYLGKDGECHMTEGQRNHLENFGSLANFNIEAADSIHASDDSSTDKEGNGKRKSVSFASEVSIQSISPAASPRKQQTAENGSQSEADTQEVESDKQELTSDKQEVTSQKETEKEIEDTSPEKGKPLSPEAGACSLDESCQGDSSSTDSAPSEFHLRLGNTTETPVLGDIVITRLCTAITAVLQDGLKHHLAGFQMFGSVQVTVWKVVEASVEIVPQTRSLCDLVQKVKQTSYLATHQQNLRVLDFWMSYLRQKEEQLAKFYNSGAILVHSPTALKKHYDDMITSLGKMSVLPFHLDMTFIKEKALTDSKFKSQEMTNSDTGMVEVAANQNADVDTPTNLTPSRSRPSMLDFSASKALNWLANATISRMQSSVDVTDSKFKTSDSTNESTDSDCSTNQVPELTNVLDDNDEVISKTIKPKYELSESQRQLYSDAKLSQLDVDPFISQNESLRSSISSATGFTSLFSTLSARLGENKSNQSRSGEQSISQSLTQSMTSSASSLMLRLTGVTDYSFQDEITKNEPVKSENPDMKVNQSDNAENPANENEASKKAVNEEKGDKEIEVKFREKKPDAQACENRNKRVSFDIVKMFDKLLLPGSNPEGKPTQPKPVSKIPVPKNRWSWNFGITKSTSPAISENQSTLSKASTDTDLKTQQLTTTKENQSKNRGKTTDSPRRNEHFPKHGPKPASTDNKLRKGSRTSTKTTASRVSAPPKPPRLVQSETDSKKSTPVHQARNKSMATLTPIVKCLVCVQF
ncbi:RUSC2-like protein, partial [Mya arenaria]